MAGNIKGITIEINGDTTKLDKALTGVNKQTTAVNKELRQVDSLLKFNPGNTELVAQKQQLLAKQVEQTSSKLKTLKDAQAQVEAQFKAGDIGEDQYRAFQREVVATEGKLDHFSGQLKDTDAFLRDNNDAAGMAAVGYSKAAVKAAQAGDDVKGLGTDAESTGDKLDKIADNTFSEKLQNIGDAFSDIGDKVKEFGDQAIDAWSEMDDAVDNLTSKTGATGAAADKLGESYEKVEASMAGSQMESEDLSNTMAGLHSVFGLTGKELENTTEYVAQFSAVTGQSGTDAVDALRDTLGKFNVQAKDIPGVLDAFTAASQSSGISVDDLESSVATAYPVFSQLHIGLKDGVGVVAQWAKGGVDATTALKGMQKASATYAKDNKTLQQGLKGTFDAITNANSPVEALNAGVEAFGTKQGPLMVSAIQSGKVSLSDLTKAATDSGGTVKNSFNQTLDPIDKATQAQKQMKQSLAEIGGEILTTVSPVLKQVADLAKQAAEAFGKLPEPVKQFIIVFGGVTVLLGILAPIIAAFVTMGGVASAVAIGIAAAIAGVVLIFKNWGTIVDWFKGIWAQMRPAMKPFMGALNALKPVLDVLKRFFMNTFDNIKMAIKGFVTFSKGLLDILVGIFTGNGEKIKQGFRKAFQGLITIGASILRQLINTVGSLFGAIVNTVSAGAKGAVAIAKSIFGGIVQVITHPIETAKNLFGKAIDAIKGFLNFKFSWPHIPMPHFGINPKGWKIGDLLKGKIPSLSVAWHAAGGIFNKPTLFAGGDGSLHGVGEAGAEAVAPLDKLMGYVQQAVANVIQNKDDGAQLSLLEVQNSLLAKMLDELMNGVPAYVDWQAGARKMQPEIERLTNAAARTRNRRLGNV
nr:phage tail tape measure protein [Lacticaseibacillus absianus]